MFKDFDIVAVAVTFLITVIVTLLYWDGHNAKILELVKMGVNPVEAKCALQDDYGTMPVCLVLATQRAGK